MSKVEDVRCGLCGALSTNPMHDIRCGGPVMCICPKCEAIIIKWEAAKKRHHAWWLGVLAERRREKKEALR